MPLPSIGKARLRRLSIKAARNSAKRRASTSMSSLKMPELQVSSPTPSENNSPPRRRLRRLSINAARKCAIRRRSVSKSIPKDDHSRDLWKKVRSTILAVTMFKRGLDCDDSREDETSSWARPRLESPTRLSPLSSKVKKRGERRLRRKSPSKKQNALLPSLSRHSVPTLRIESTTPW